MNYFSAVLILLIAPAVFSINMAYSLIEITPFDLQVSSEDFYEPNLGRYHLVMKPGDSQQVTIQVTNNDSNAHTIELQMTKETPRPERSFEFEPAHLDIRPGETKTSILTVHASPDASTGTTILHTVIAKSTTFGAKAFGFYVRVDKDVSPPSPDMVRRGSPGGMFSSQTQFDIDEKYAMSKVPYNILPPVIPEDYLFRGMYGLDEPKQLIYSKQPLSSDTGELDFWDNGGLLIIFFEKEDFFTFDERLGFLDLNEQQVKVNGKNGVASESKLLLESNVQRTYSNSRVTVFLDDVDLRITSQMPLDQILRVAESMTPSDVEEIKYKMILKKQFIDDFDLAAEEDNVFVVWEEFDKDKADVFIAKSTDGGSNFSAKLNISNSPGIPREPIVKVSGNYVYVVWYEMTRYGDASTEDVYIASSSDGGKTFSDPVILSKDNHYGPNTSNFDPDVAAVGKNVHVVWLTGQHDWFQTFLASSYDGGKTFEYKRLSKNDDEMSHNPIVSASGNNVYAGWSQRIEPNVYQAKMMITVSNDNGKSFSLPKDLSPSKTTSHEQTIYAFDDNVFVSWRDEVDKRNVSMVKSSDSGKTFSDLKSIAYGARPEIAGQDSIFVVVWCGDDDRLDQICIIKSPDGGDTFLEQVQISNITWTKSPYADAPTPKIDIQNDTLYISWKYPPEGGGQDNLYLVTSRDGGDTFSEQKVIGQTDEDPKIVVSEDKMYLLWTDDLGEGSNLNLATASHPYDKIECSPGTTANGTSCLPVCDDGFFYKDGFCVAADPEPDTNGCLIATATFGSELAPQVQMLREVRDDVLLSTYSGSLFMDGFNTIYYSFSPTVAQWENENTIFKDVVKISITPMITALSIMTMAEESSEIQVVGYGLATLMLIVGMYVVAPASLVWKARKRG